MAAPVGGQIFSEILPYLEVSQGNKEELELKEEVTIPDIIGKTLQEAENILKKEGIEMKINNEIENLDKNSIIIKNQTPQSGIIVYKGSDIYVDY